MNTLLKQYAYQNKPLDFDQAYLLGIFSLIPYITELRGLLDLPTEMITLQSIAALCAFHNHALYQKENSGEQIAGICAAIFDYDIGTSLNGFLIPQKEVMDNCGMGGDLYRTPNLSTIAALIAATGEISMLKHGSPGSTNNVGSSDFLQYNQVYLFPSTETIIKTIQKYNFGYIDALDENYKRIHILSHGKAKLAHMNDIIGPITSPVHPSSLRQKILGVNHLLPPERVAEAYLILNAKGITSVEQGLFIRGYSSTEREEGIDEVSITSGGTRVVELDRGKVISYHLFARDFGLAEVGIQELDPGVDKALTSTNILRGKILGAKKSAVLANAALLFYVAQGKEFNKGTNLARLILDSGLPYALLQQYAHATRFDK